VPKSRITCDHVNTHHTLQAMARHIIETGLSFPKAGSDAGEARLGLRACTSAATRYLLIANNK